MARITRDGMLMEIAHAVAKRGTCSRLRVGAVVSRDGRIITTGYNGAPSGIAHCQHEPNEDLWAAVEGMPAKGCQNAEHAERNAIAFAARYGLALEGGVLHTTHAPCLDCARSIINAGIVRVVYETPYRITLGVELLEIARIQVVYRPSNRG